VGELSIAHGGATKREEAVSEENKIYFLQSTRAYLWALAKPFARKRPGIIACCTGRSEESMVFAKRLREGVVRGAITCSVRIWTRSHVTEGRRYRMGDGEIEIESVTPIGFPDITPELARESGFLGVLDLLKVAKHGKGNNIYLIRFHYIPPRRKRRAARTDRKKSAS
jgi:hypothetical protein